MGKTMLSRDEKHFCLEQFIPERRTGPKVARGRIQASKMLRALARQALDCA